MTIPVTSKLVDNNGHAFGVDRVDNSQIVYNVPIGTAIGSGKIPTMSAIHKFGNAPNFDDTDLSVTVWDGADDDGIDEMQYTYSTTAAIDTLSSSDAGDTQEVEVQGLDRDWNTAIQVIRLAGQTQVTLTEPLIRVVRVKNLGSTNNAGSVYVFEQTVDVGGDGIPDDTTKIRAVMRPGANQTLMAVYAVPKGKTAQMLSFYAGLSGAKRSASYNVEMLARPVGGVFQIKHLSNLTEDGTSHWNHQYQLPQPFPQRTDIEMRVSINTAPITDASVSAGFDLVLVDM